MCGAHGVSRAEIFQSYRCFILFCFVVAWNAIWVRSPTLFEFHLKMLSFVSVFWAEMRFWSCKAIFPISIPKQHLLAKHIHFNCAHYYYCCWQQQQQQQQKWTMSILKWYFSFCSLHQQAKWKICSVFVEKLEKYGSSQKIDSSATACATLNFPSNFMAVIICVPLFYFIVNKNGIKTIKKNSHRTPQLRHKNRWQMTRQWYDVNNHFE